ncbi:MAG: L-threonylcarbamoyladenylate synthase [Cyclobacteriaceae bacterium]|nr:L-threonylcarbamoyladenylate synthase [Cyclobacteriaceae bacterium]
MAEIGQDIIQAKNLLDQGELVAIPTETVYGLAGNARNESAVARIFEVKKRPFFDPLIVHIGAISQLSEIADDLPSWAEALAHKFWPGPLTLVLPKSPAIPDLVSAGLPTVAVRMPNHNLTLNLLSTLSYPLAAPSANPFGYISPTTAEHVQAQLGDDIAYILDGGPCMVGIESTIVGYDDSNAIIYRKGGIPLEEIAEITGSLTRVEDHSDPLAPGMLKSHYAPSKKVVMGEISDLLKTHASQQIGILSFRKQFSEVAASRQIQLTSDGDLKEAAKNLFAALRKLDAMPITHILVEPVPDQGLGQAINDRLRRASS